MMYPIIMAGGSGTRLWPVSRKNNPKQIKPFIDDDTLLQKTYKRLLGGFKDENIYITTSPALKETILEQLPSFSGGNFSLEPCRRGTAAALGLALIKVLHRDPNSTFVFINSDNYIKNEQAFLQLLNTAEKIIQYRPDHVILGGIKPEYPETGFGYIKMGEKLNEQVDLAIQGNEVYLVEKFVEKPDLETAKEFVSSGKYLWDPTLIAARVDHFLSLFKKHLPETYDHLIEIKKYIDTPQEEEVIKSRFQLMTDLAIDYGITEKEDKMLVIPADIGWSDVGNWRAIKDILSDSKEGNIVKGEYIGVDSHNNLIHSSGKKIIGTIGLCDMIVVETEDALLICPKDRAQDVKKIVAKIKEQGLEHYL
ncbi:MAG: mannose-1-phosphate guanylyltransferase [Parcubacteria group bacterium]|nr:mannose-1-phosphate guanylyltransferase [Parcubacteria group bacterium]